MYQSNDELLKTGFFKLLKIKDSDIRISTLKQGDQAVDRGIHMGGAFSATVPIVSLFYGGFMNLDIDDPTRIGQDIFVLSKGHAVATMASVYADLGYFDPSLLVNSRSVDSILNGHPGPVLPGVHVATGPLGQGVAVAHGFAMAGKSAPEFNVFCVTGDGELQEGVVWEAIMHAPQKRLDNLCMLVDKNEGQLDNPDQLIVSMDNLPKQIESFGWRVLDIDGTSHSAVVDALDAFTKLPRDGRPTAIVCNTKKGFGSFSKGLNLHKITLTKDLYEQEMVLQTARREARVEEFLEYKRSKDPIKLKTFRNTVLGETWAQEIGETIDWKMLRRRAEFYENCPNDVVVITGGIDVQDNRLEIEVVGWLEDESSFSLRFEQFYGNVSEKQVWNDLTDFLRTEFKRDDGVLLKIGAACVDRGDNTILVYDWVKRVRNFRIWAVKGFGGFNRAPISRPSGRNKYGVNVFPLGVDVLKEKFYGVLRINDPGPSYCHFPMYYGDDYFKQLTAEKLVKKYKKLREIRSFRKIRDRNEALDCRIYAYSCLKILKPNFAILKKRLLKSINKNGDSSNDPD